MALKFGQKLKQIVGHVAPMLGTAIGGPFGGIAGKMVQEALGVDTEEAALHELASNPESLLKLKQAEQAFATRMRELDIDLERLNTDDRANARARQIAVKDSMPAQVFYITSFGFFGALAFMFAYGMPDTGGDALLIMLGSLGTAWGASVAYFVGSSAGSKQKTELMGTVK